jgi:hypothetical protein
VLNAKKEAAAAQASLAHPHRREESGSDISNSASAMEKGSTA